MKDPELVDLLSVRSAVLLSHPAMFYDLLFTTGDGRGHQRSLEVSFVNQPSLYHNDNLSIQINVANLARWIRSVVLCNMLCLAGTRARCHLFNHSDTIS